MKININKLKIKTQLLMLTAASLLLMLLILFITDYQSVSIIRENNSQYINQDMNQISKGLSSKCDMLEKIASSITMNTSIQNFIFNVDGLSKYENAIMISNYLSGENTVDDSIIDIAVIPNVGTSFDLLGSVTEISKNIEGFKTGGGIYYSGLKHLNIGGTATNCILVVMEVYSNHIDDRYGEIIGKIVLVVDSSKLSENIGNMSKSDENVIYLVDRDKTIYSSNDDSIVGKKINTVIQGFRENTASFESKIGAKECFVYLQNFNKYNGIIVSTVSKESLLNKINKVRILDVILFFIGILILIIPFSIVLKNIVNPLKKLSSFMSEVKEGNIKNLKNRISLRGHEEVITLSNDFNGMLDEIDSLTHRLLTTSSQLYGAEISKKQTELAFLQSQINPHFLYNTLESIKGIALYRGVPEIRDIAQALADIFRYSIKGGDTVPLKDEIKILKSYIQINQIRFVERFVVEYCIAAEVEDMEIPKMILQPLAENAIYHGVELKDGIGHLFVCCTYNQNGYIDILFKDDGLGIEEARLQKIRNELLKTPEDVNNTSTYESLGLRNVNNRIKLKYGSDFEMTITSEPGIGTEVKLKIPAKKVHDV
jgi:two-component system sensor histidine kinase YesM